MSEFKLPDLGEGIPDAEIVEWQVQPGDWVEADQILLSVETAKAIVDIPSPRSGVIEALCGQPGDSILTGAPLLRFVDESTPDTASSTTVVGQLQSAGDEVEEDTFYIGAAPSTRPYLETPPTRPPLTSAPVRQLAAQLGVDLRGLKPLPGQEQITHDQIREAARGGAGPHLLQVTGGEPLKGVRKHMARTMASSHAQVVPVSIFDQADIEHWPQKTDISVRVIRAIAEACQAEPNLNAWFDGASLRLQPHPQIDLGIAVDTPQGLFVPVLRQISERSDQELREGIEAMRRDVTDRSIPPAELQGATLILSNFGTMSGRFATPIVVPPMVAIIGTGKISREPVAIGDQVRVHRRLPLSLTFDHRAVTGGEAARFLARMVAALEAE